MTDSLTMMRPDNQTFEEVCTFRFAERLDIPYPNMNYSGIFLIEIKKGLDKAILDKFFSNSDQKLLEEKQNSELNMIKRYDNEQHRGWMPIYVGQNEILSIGIAEAVIHCMDILMAIESDVRNDLHNSLFRLSTMCTSKMVRKRAERTHYYLRGQSRLGEKNRL